jgi:MerR family transcriptional regulator/heat shock protein HspR
MPRGRRPTRPAGATPGQRFYMISTLAQSYGIHQQTLRMYEREGLLKPSRSEGNTRLYTDEDMKRLELILSLSRDLGVNLAGIDVILKLRGQIEQMQKEMNEFVSWVREEMKQGAREGFAERLEQALVRLPPQGIVRVETPSPPPPAASPASGTSQS